jgi:hypothetical protein
MFFQSSGIVAIWVGDVGLVISTSWGDPRRASSLSVYWHSNPPLPARNALLACRRRVGYRTAVWTV